MSEFQPRIPFRPLIWPDIIRDLRDAFQSSPDLIYIVGGAVRDALMHRPVHDIDLVTGENSIRLARQIADHFGGDVFVLDSERGVGRALVDTPVGRVVLDVSRLRGPDLLADLADRDFTLNAMAVDLRGDLSLLIDPLAGEQDVADKRIRMCSPDALRSDPIRTIRAVRFSHQFGFRLEAGTQRAVREAVPLLATVSQERVRDEWFRLLALARPSGGLRVAQVMGLLSMILPEVAALVDQPGEPPFEGDCWGQTLATVDSLTSILATISYRRTDNTVASFSYGVMATQLDRFRRPLIEHLSFQWPEGRSHTALLMLAALLLPLNDLALLDRRVRALRLSNGERQRLLAMTRAARVPLDGRDMSNLGRHRYWRDLGGAGVDACLLALARYLGQHVLHVDQVAWLTQVKHASELFEAFFEQPDVLVTPPALVDGGELMRALRVPSGPLIGELLTRIREAQVMGEIHTRNDALNLARRLTDSGRSD